MWTNDVVVERIGGRASGPPEADLVVAARAGDRGAWEALYRSVYPGLRAYLARRLGAAHAEDAVSETMTRAVAGIDRFELGPAGFTGWVYGIARRVVADHYRKGARFGRQRLAASRAVPPQGPLPGEGLVLAEEHAAVREAFVHLTPAEQELLELRVVAGLSAEEVAAVLGKKPGAVRTAQYRAMGHLREIMDRTSDE